MGRKIFLFLLISAHIGFMGMLIGAKSQKQRKKNTPLVVKTVFLKPSSSPIQKQSIAQKKTLIPKPIKPLVKKNPSVKKQKERRIPTPKIPLQEFDIPPSILKQLEESIAKIEQKDDKQCKSSTIVTASLSPKVAETPAQEEPALPSYTASLVKKLTQMLQLPEYGEVKIKITISPSGKILELLVLQAESKANKLYLEKCLPNIILPKYNEKALNNEQTLTLTFCNAL
ncbi:hypothetical protein [Candidatus Rhabdochlamydia porcellionis]|jgi:hypothetical protein|uniref:TolA protein n=1 Tax=Candidatus Rhabdochlamydia porcellionis TaxID=225148 RepID=A0ABX8Z269_9BACT|nr:hypothetical protein [Candidatus Rhabdochlamydia porcellionis]QZA58207.1 hypothetical protein RHAB15C_0000077 [Candidatus Rhabdochlamydia porcellionis]